EADDAVQEAWLRLSRSDTGAVENLGGWLTTVVARVCLDMLRSRKSRREESLETDGSRLIMGREDERDPEHEVELSESVGLALLAVLETLAPAERVTFVLHDIVLPRIYGFSTLGDPLQLLALGSVFLLATSFMAQAVGAWFKRPETPTLIFLATSLPQFFLTGFAWPREAIPQAALVAGHVFPVDFAINGIVRIDQLGAN